MPAIARRRLHHRPPGGVALGSRESQPARTDRRGLKDAQPRSRASASARSKARRCASSAIPAAATACARFWTTTTTSATSSSSRPRPLRSGQRTRPAAPCGPERAQLALSTPAAEGPGGEWPARSVPMPGPQRGVPRMNRHPCRDSTSVRGCLQRGLAGSGPALCGPEIGVEGPRRALVSVRFLLGAVQVVQV